MRTTVDLPESLLRRAKSQAALRGMTLTALFTEAVAAAVGEPGPPAAPPRARTDSQVLGRAGTFPLIRGADGPALKDLTPERIHALLEEEELERSVRPRRRQRVGRHPA